ncbi:uncharacterized protein LOC111704431 isoform X3 [Eurytemora carolleeae]|uniref:uncharacterized protein LOC111704431 isoform X3 n=1 Tax=Eurytemora carolleeae TaxID=1294199 RepID=UPI000C78DAF1|nr:uncharacterized protein LOC111704431 isoform X3 [Eurytemora carolleeae]|eukprot:XP_023332438.1 uncharacterized protein LOC111704431 isoform X3 [Eurytemora affinis]
MRRPSFFLIKPCDGGHQFKREKTGRGSPLYTVHSATLRSASQLELKLTQEKHPPSKETKRLLKQRSQESIKQELLHSKEKESGRVEEQHLRKEKEDNGEWSVLRTNFPYIDQSPLDQGLGGFRVPGADQTNSISTLGTRTETYEDEEKRKDSVSTIQSVSCRNSFLGPPPSDERGKKTKKGLSSNAYSVPNLNPPATSPSTLHPCPSPPPSTSTPPPSYPTEVQTKM